MLTSDLRRDLVHEVDVTSRSNRQPFDERWNRTGDVDFDPIVNPTSKQVEDTADASQVDAVHKPSPDCRKSRLPQVFVQNDPDPIADRADLQPL